MKINNPLLKETVSLWGEYLRYVNKVNNLVRARNIKKEDNWKEKNPGRLVEPYTLEEPKIISIIGFLEYLNEKTS